MKIHNVEQGTDEWLALRAGKPTASEFSKLITSKGEPSKSMPTYAAGLAAEKFAGKPLSSFNGNVWTDRGTELEPAARDLYAFTHNCEVDQVGFITDDAEQYGCSPDGLVGNDGMAEYKCQKTENHIKTLLYYKKYKKCPSDYVQQTQGQLLLAEREWDDLVFYHPDLPMLVIRQERDEEFIKKLQNQLALVVHERDKILEIIKEFNDE
jgi:hypothetical protein